MNTIVLDFETYFDDDYSLSKMTTEAYVRDPRFEAHGVGIRYDDYDNGKMFFFSQTDNIAFGLKWIDWSDTAVLCHHAAFDGLILSHHYGIKPARWLDTYSMAQFLFGPGQSKSLAGLAERFGLGEKTIDYSFKGKHWPDLTAREQKALADGCLRDCELTRQVFNKMMTGDY